MKNLISPFIILFVLSLCVTNVYSQSNVNRNADHYIPLHATLKAGDGGTTKSLLDNKIAYRHDAWQNGTWAFTDSGRFSYNSQGLVIDNSTLSYLTSGDWTNNTNDTYTYDQTGTQLAHLTQKGIAGENSWENENNYTVTLNNAGLALNQTYQIWTDGGWQNTYQFINTYDANNNLQEQVEQAWNTTGNNWKNTKRTTQTTRTNQLLDAVIQSWDEASGSWINYYQMLYLYNSHGEQVRQIEQLWQNNGWVDFYKDSTAYNARNNATQYISQQFDTAKVWINKFQTERTYDNNHNLIVLAQYNWNATARVWTPLFYDTYTYNAANELLNKTETNWNVPQAAYVNAYKADYTYDGNNNLITFNDYHWSTGSWVPNTAISYNIDGNNKTVYELDQVYDANSNTMANTNQYYYYYTIYAPTAIQNVQNDLGAELYPNPTTGNNITISLTAAQNIDITLNTYDESGKLVNSEMRTAYNGANNIKISYPNLSSGIYFMHLINRNDNSVSVLKFVKD